MPRRVATAFAVRSLSPVAMMIRKPSRWSAFESSRGGVLHRIGDADHPGEPSIERDEHHSLALVASVVGRFGQRFDLEPEILHQLQVADLDRLAVDGASDPLAGHRFEVCRLGQRDATVLGSPNDCLGQRVLGALLQGRSQLQYRDLVVAGCGQDGHQLGLPLRQRTGLVDDERVDRFEPLQRLGVLDEHPHLGAAPRRRHDRHGGRETQCARTRDDQDRNRGEQRVGERGCGAPYRPDDERAGRDRDYHRHEQARHPVSVSLDGCPAPLRVLDHLDDLAQHRAGARLASPP